MKYTILFKSGTKMDFTSTVDIDFANIIELKPLTIIAKQGKSLWVNLAEVEYITKENKND